METKTINSALIITVALILIATVVAPVVSFAEDVSGAKYTYVNEEYSPANPIGEYTKNVIIDIGPTPEVSGQMTVTVNGEAFNLTQDQNTVILSSDYVFANKSTGGNSINLIYNGTNYPLSGTSTAHLEFTNGVMSATINNVVMEDLPYTKLVTLQRGGNWTMPHTSVAQFSSINDVIISGYVTVNSQILEFAIINGEVISLGGLEGHETVATWELERVSGTTDVYKFKTLSVSVDGTAAGLARILAVTEVHGHEVAEDLIPLYAIIPTMLIVSVLALAVGMVMRNKQ